MTRQELLARTDVFATEVELFSRPMLRRIETVDAARQLRRASTGVASNYGSASVARSHAEFTSKIGTVLDEANESLRWLRFLRNTRLVEGPELDRLQQEALELTRIFQASYKTSKNNRRNRPRRRQTTDND